MEGKGSSIGTTDAEGKYSLTTFRSNDGALPGQYKVSIVKYDPSSAPPPTAPTTPPPGQLASGDLDANYVPPSNSSSTATSAETGPKNLIPAKYASADTSGLRGMIAEGDENVNDFELK
jgi:hypothetical protein